MQEKRKAMKFIRIPRRRNFNAPRHPTWRTKVNDVEGEDVEDATCARALGRLDEASSLVIRK